MNTHSHSLIHSHPTYIFSLSLSHTHTYSLSHPHSTLQTFHLSLSLTHTLTSTNTFSPKHSLKHVHASSFLSPSYVSISFLPLSLFFFLSHTLSKQSHQISQHPKLSHPFSCICQTSILSHNLFFSFFFSDFINHPHFLTIFLSHYLSFSISHPRIFSHSH